MQQERLDTYTALEKACEAFEKYLTKLGYDTSYWDLRLIAWGLSIDKFESLWKIELDLREGNHSK